MNNILIPEFILVEIYNLVESDVVDVQERLSNILKKYFERQSDVLKENWRQDIIFRLFKKNNSMVLGEPIGFNFAHLNDLSFSIEGVLYAGLDEIFVPDWLHKSVKESFLKLQEQHSALIEMFAFIKNKKDLKSFLNNYILGYKNNVIHASYYSKDTHLKVFETFIEEKINIGLHLGHLEVTPSVFFSFIYKLNNILENEQLDFYKNEKQKYRFIEFLFVLQQKGKIQIKWIENEINNNPVYDSWKMVINAKTYNAEDNQLIEINDSFDGILYYNYSQKKVQIEDGFYLLTSALNDTLKIFIDNPNQKIPIEKFFSEKSLQDHNLVRQRISRLKQKVPPLSEYIPKASKDDCGYILKISKDKIVKIK